jgi:hypothetical protein
MKFRPGNSIEVRTDLFANVSNQLENNTNMFQVVNNERIERIVEKEVNGNVENSKEDFGNFSEKRLENIEIINEGNNNKSNYNGSNDNINEIIYTQIPNTPPDKYERFKIKLKKGLFHQI